MGLGQLFELAFLVEQVVPRHHRPQDRIGLQQFDLRCQELVGIEWIAAARVVLADNRICRLAVNIDGCGGLKDRRHSFGHHESGHCTEAHERDDLPQVTLDNPEVVRQRQPLIGGLLFAAKLRPIHVLRHHPLLEMLALRGHGSQRGRYCFG